MSANPEKHNHRANCAVLVMTKIDNFYEMVVKEQFFSIFSTDSVSDLESFVIF